jgi:hypothetical protein
MIGQLLALIALAFIINGLVRDAQLGTHRWT